MNRRILLLQAPASRLPLQTCLLDCGFEVARAGDPAEAKDTALSTGCGMGIAVIDLPHPWPVVDLEEAMIESRLEWIAVIPRSAMRNTALCRTLLHACYDFHTLPLDFERLRTFIGHALGKAELAGRLEAGADTPGGVYGMVGRSPVMLELYRSLGKIARFEAPVLIGGESGTGKEVTARAIHRLSARTKGPFVPVNCGSLPVNLVHSELFGHEKGSFTGAYQRKIGSIEAAHGGVVFLDEIGDLPLELQASLLRFLQEKTIVRLGSTQHIHIDVRVIAASHVDLAESVKRGRFREDLYYRLNVLPLRVPALRHRSSDISLLAHAFFAQFGAQKSAQVSGFSHGALAAMEAYSWPGNVRELMNRVQQAMIMCDKQLISAADLGLARESGGAELISLRTARGVTERDIVHHTLLMNGSNKAAAARQLGVSRTTLYRLINKLDIGARSRDTDREKDEVDAAGRKHVTPDHAQGGSRDAERL